VHEAGLASDIAAALRGRLPLPPGARVRLLVTSGHHEPEEFDAALRLHLRGQLPDVEPLIDITHVPVERLCVACGGTWAAVRADAACPGCGGDALPLPVPERVDVELVHPAVDVGGAS
jgi:Zn finger protein HypA/HybF involved in hydrogenase expression